MEKAQRKQGRQAKTGGNGEKKARDKAINRKIERWAEAKADWSIAELFRIKRGRARRRAHGPSPLFHTSRPDCLLFGANRLEQFRRSPAAVKHRWGSLESVSQPPRRDPAPMIGAVLGRCVFRSLLCGSLKPAQLLEHTLTAPNYPRPPLD